MKVKNNHKEQLQPIIVVKDRMGVRYTCLPVERRAVLQRCKPQRRRRAEFTALYIDGNYKYTVSGKKISVNDYVSVVNAENKVVKAKVIELKYGGPNGNGDGFTPPFTRK